MRHPPPALRRARKLQTLAKLLARKDVKQPELHDNPVNAGADRPGDQRLRVDRLPIGIRHRRIKAGHPPDMGRGRDFPKQPGSRKVRGNHPRDIARILRGRRILGHKIRGRKGQRLDHAFGDLDPQRAILGRRRGRKHPGHKQGQQDCGAEGSDHHHLILMFSGLNTISTLRHCSYFSGGSLKPVAPQRIIARLAAS